MQAEWLRPMTELDVYRKAYAVTTYLGSAVAAEPIVNATPPVRSVGPPSIQLVQGSPTTYLVDGQPVAMVRHDVQVEVKRPDGSLEIVSQPQWWTLRSRSGPGVRFAVDRRRRGERRHRLCIRRSQRDQPAHAEHLVRPRSGEGRRRRARRDPGETQGVPRWSIIAADSEGEALLSQNQVVFDGTQCPDAVTLLTYSQSQDPTSPHHADQTRLYSEKRWVTGRFCLDDILASPALERLVLPN